MNATDLLPAVSACALVALAVWNGIDTARRVASLRAERIAQGHREPS